MRLADVIRPIAVEDFKTGFYGKQCFVIKRKHNPLTDLLTLDELETRLGDGVATSHQLTFIQPDGMKIPSDQLRIKQTAAAWAPSFVDKKRVQSLLAEGCSFVMHNMSAITPRVEALIADIESLTPGIQADLHIYVSPKANATAYLVHRDQPQHKIYLQLFGTTQWTVYKGEDPRRAMPVEEADKLLSVDFEATMTPGSVLYMPPGVFHRATNPHGPRVSLSIPFYASPEAKPIDRTPVRLSALRELLAG